MTDIAQMQQRIFELEDALGKAQQKEKEWLEVKQSAVEIIQYDSMMSHQSPYWRSMLLSLAQSFSLDQEIIEQHIEFRIQHDGLEISNISMIPKTDKGMKLIQIWGVVDMLCEMVKNLGLSNNTEKAKTAEE